MKFNHTYYHSMDQGYYVEPGQEEKTGLSSSPENIQADTEFGPEEIGFGSNPFQRPKDAVNARIKQGVGYIDIPFFGSGKGNKERYTPESISKKERRDIKELAEMNKVKLSTHASTNIQGLAGFGQQGFDENKRENDLKEIKKAIDFASDLQGGAVVFHTGEWQRPYSEQKWNEDKMFVNYPEEENQAVLHLVDTRSGRVIQGVQKSQVVYEPEYEETEDGNYWIDLEGNKVPKDGDLTDQDYIEKLLKRKPKWDPENEKFETNPLTWEDFERRAEENNTTPEEEYYFVQKQEQLMRSRGQSLYYTSSGYEGAKERLDALNEAREFYERLEDNIPEEEKWKIMREKKLLPEGITGPTKKQSPVEIIDEHLTHAKRRLKHIHEASSAADVQAQNIIEELNHVKPVYEYGVKKSADTIARAGEFAWQKSRQKKKDNEMFRDIYVSPESYMPDLYGSHPDEIRKIIDSSRENMKEIMMKKHGMSESRAEEISENHIKGTLDVGHFNMWRKHFKAEPGETPEDTDERFNKWFLEQVDQLVNEDGVIGQVHITDNMGYDDEHLTPGEGTVPMKEVMEMIEEAGIDDMVVEAGSFNPVDVVPDTFSYFGSPVYRMAKGPSFSQMHQKHFGYNAPPFYMVGAYAPSNEWRLWSDVQLE